MTATHQGSVLLCPKIWHAHDALGAKQITSHRDDPSVSVIDAYEAQLRDLLRTRAPTQMLSQSELDALVKQELGSTSLVDHGAWIFYPWSRRLVHVLDKTAFRELRTNRNQHKIQRHQQELLRKKTIGIVGLSVGHSAALTLALEGIGGHFRLADFDVLDLSNLNRIRSGIHNLGVNKAVFTAQEMLELNPYLQIEVFTEGITQDNIESFFSGDPALDLVVDECDDLYAKVRLREVARSKGIPLLMDTSDGGLLDVERFDLEPERPVFHGATADLAAESVKSLTTPEKIPYVLAILGTKDISPELAGAMVEIGQTLSTWPQLGSSVTLGGALVTHVARSIFLTNDPKSGRFSVDLDALTRSDASALPPRADYLEPTIAQEAMALPREPSRPHCRVLDSEARQYVLEFASRAPSVGNLQPWQFAWHKDTLCCSIDTQFVTDRDKEQREARLAVGAAVENVRLAASNLGWQIRVQTDDASFFQVCTVLFVEADVAPSPLAREVFRRCTNRHIGPGGRLQEHEVRALVGAAGDYTNVRVLLEDRDKQQFADISANQHRQRLLSPSLHEAFFSQLRWTLQDVQERRDGIDLATMEATSADRAMLEILARPDVRAFLSEVKGGGALGARYHSAALGSAGIVLLSQAKGASWLHGGMFMQRVWLTATSLNLGVWPVDVSLCSTNLVPDDETLVLALQLSRVPAPSAYSLRRLRS